jgi:glycosyltransferase involved in cell wall biosynthesis
MLRIGFVCPTYDAENLHAYTETSLVSFFKTTPGGVAIVVDDGSKSWSNEYESRLKKLVKPYPNSALCIYHYSVNGGLTRSWNLGLKIADDMKLDYAIAGNNDVIFTPFWYDGLLHAVNNGYALVGPLSNAPGVTAKGYQEVNRYYPDYKLSDDEAYLEAVAAYLHDSKLGQIVETHINGFFQFAAMESWRKGKFDSRHFYRPVNTHTSNGQRNPTPLMTLNEDELQARWTALNMPSAVVLSSFIFHYRAVSRGDRYKRGKWFRKS